MKQFKDIYDQYQWDEVKESILAKTSVDVEALWKIKTEH